jgi:hypothetical protein
MLVAQALTTAAHLWLLAYIKTAGHDGGTAIVMWIAMAVGASAIPLIGLWIAQRLNASRHSRPRRAWLVFAVGFNLLAAFTATAIRVVEDGSPGLLSFHLEFVFFIAFTIGGIAHWISFDETARPEQTNR